MAKQTLPKRFLRKISGSFRADLRDSVTACKVVRQPRAKKPSLLFVRPTKSGLKKSLSPRFVQAKAYRTSLFTPPHCHASKLGYVAPVYANTGRASYIELDSQPDIHVCSLLYFLLTAVCAHVARFQALCTLLDKLKKKKKKFLPLTSTSVGRSFAVRASSEKLSSLSSSPRRVVAAASDIGTLLRPVNF